MRDGEAIDDRWIEIVENRAPMVEKDQWHASARTDVAIGKGRSCSTDRQIRRIDIAHNRSGVADITGHHLLHSSAETGLPKIGRTRPDRAASPLRTKRCTC